MSDWPVTPEFEEQIRRSFGAPPIRNESVETLGRALQQRGAHFSGRRRLATRLRTAPAMLLGLLVVLVLATLLIGPQRVYARIRMLLGYIPGVGLVDPEGSTRMLPEPVRQTRDGITVAVNQAFLLQDETRLDYGVSGVPLSAYPPGEAVTGCIEQPYLQLPDGSRLGMDAPVPQDIYQLTFVMPCIFNTLPGSVPEGWELRLYFVDAPEDLEVLAVQEVLPSPAATVNQEPADEVAVSAETTRAEVSVDSFIRTEDGYILLGSVRSFAPQGSWLQTTGPLVLRDAAGDPVSYGFPEDIQLPQEQDAGPGGYSWAIGINGAGLVFPLTISSSGLLVSDVELEQPVRVVFEAGAAPQPGQTWDLNQEIRLGEYAVTLVSVTAVEDGYSFSIDPGSDLVSVNLSIEGFQAVAAGGGGMFGGPFQTSLLYGELPAGTLMLLFDHPAAAGPVETWHTEWKPDEAQQFDPAQAPAACWNAATYGSILPLPAGLDGQVLVAQADPAMQLVLSELDGSGQQVLAEGSVHGALSPDGSLLASADETGLRIRNLETGEESLIPGGAGISPHWSPDGRRLAVVSVGDVYGILVYSLDGGKAVQLSNLGYESIAGWSPDGSLLYYAIPGSSEQGFDLWQVDVESGAQQALMVLEGSSLKAPFPALSPDGGQVAYRGRDNSSLYLLELAGGAPRLVPDSPALAISGIAWEREGHLLGVSLITAENQQGEIILLAPDSCEAYRLPGVEGTLVAVHAR